MTETTNATRSPMPHRRSGAASVLVLLLWAAVCPAGDSGIEGPGKWLVDKARDLGLTLDRSATRDGAQHLRVWLEAASRIDPQLAESYRWQYDLAVRLGDTEEAARALERYRELRPDDAVSCIGRVTDQLDALQTSEKRMDLCRQALETATAAELVSDLHARLAEFFYRRGDAQGAEDHARRAVRAAPQNASARGLLVALRGLIGTPEARAEALLAQIAATGGDANVYWELARCLSGLSLHQEAMDWFGHARDAVRGENARASVGLAFDAAQCAYDEGDHVAAAERCKAILRDDPAMVDARLLLLLAARKLGRHDEADAQRDELRRRFRESESEILGSMNAVGAARIAWFYAVYDVDPPRAAKFADFAFTVAPKAPVVRRVYGISRVLSGDLETARGVLQPLQGTDPWAAEAMACILIADGNDAGALAILREAEKTRYSGMAYERIVRKIESLGELPAPKPDRSWLKLALAEFDQRVVRFARSPSEFLSLDVALLDERIVQGRPIACEISLTNRGAFPITLGPGAMVAPSVVVSVRADYGDGSAPVVDEAYLSIAIQNRLMLSPGETVRVAQTLDVGAARRRKLHQPQLPATFTFGFLLDPVESVGGVWKSHLPGFDPVTVTLRREPVSLGQAPANNPAGLAGDDLPPRLAAAAELLRESLAKDQQTRLMRDVLDALAGAPPSARARLMDALGRDGLDPAFIPHVAPQLSDADWLVRLTAIDALARQQGSKFAKVLDRVRQSDPDPLVRRLAELHLSAVQQKTE